MKFLSFFSVKHLLSTEQVIIVIFGWRSYFIPNTHILDAILEVLSSCCPRIITDQVDTIKFSFRVYYALLIREGLAQTVIEILGFQLSLGNDASKMGSGNYRSRSLRAVSIQRCKMPVHRSLRFFLLSLSSV